jgi:hypothetical protein
VCNIFEFELGILPDVLLDVEEGGHEGASVDFLGIGETQNVGLLLSVKVVVDVDGVVNTVDNEVNSFPGGDFVIGVSFLLTKLHILKGGKGNTKFLIVIALFVLSSTVFALVGVAVVLPSLLDLILTPLLVLHLQEDLLDLCALCLQVGGEFG